MHQAHNIPWALLASHLSYRIPQESGVPQRLDIWPRGKLHQTNDVKHFARRFGAAIKEFSITERAKYPKEFPAPYTGFFLPKEQLKSFKEMHSKDDSFLPIEERCCLIETWLPQKDETLFVSETDLADTVQTALSLPDQSPLLMLANHPSVDLYEYHYISSCGYNRGFGEAARTAIRLYLLLNLLEACDIFLRPEAHSVITHMDRVKDIVWDVNHWGPLKRTSQWAYLTRWNNNPLAVNHGPYNTFVDLIANSTLNEMTRKNVLCKQLWGIMYRYDMLMTELGYAVHWDEMVLEELRYTWFFCIYEKDEEYRGHCMFVTCLNCNTVHY